MIIIIKLSIIFSKPYKSDVGNGRDRLYNHSETLFIQPFCYIIDNSPVEGVEKLPLRSNTNVLD